jgi:hypothetical protein
VLRVALAVALLVLAGCRRSPAGPAASFLVAAVRDLGPLPQAAPIKGRDGGYSGLFAGRSVWLYGDTILASAGEDGTAWRNNTASLTSDLDASDGLGGFSEERDARGAPREAYPQTADEHDFNIAHSEVLRGKDGCQKPCGARWAIWPGPLVDDTARQRALLPYVEIYGEPGDWNFRGVGTGLATWEGPGKPVVRPEVRPGTAHPTLLFQESEPGFASAAAIHDGQLHLFGCGGTRKECRLARAPLDRVLDRSAWTFFAGGERWSAQLDEAVSLFEGMDMTTVHWNSSLRSWLAVYSPPFDNRLMMRSAPQLTGPWSAPVKVADLLPPAKAGEFAYSGLGHAEYARDNGRFEYATYYRSTGDWQGEVRLLELELRRR